LSKKKSFDEMWEEAKEQGLDQKDFAEELYKEMTKNKVADSLIQAVVYVLSENDSLHKWIEDSFATKEELQDTDETLAKHKHLPDGKAVEAL
jgi:hypothetical protein